ncbi:DUF7000 family protein [Lapidilactobacillus bayanensis]
MRFGIILNHQKIQFEFWAMAQTTERQLDYWEK